MRLSIEGPVVRVALSERNLRALLAKLDGHPPESARTIAYDTLDGYHLLVTAEPDAVHYANPERDHPWPGVMHPDTEAEL
jgi:hypothetical protein